MLYSHRLKKQLRYISKRFRLNHPAFIIRKEEDIGKNNTWFSCNTSTSVATGVLCCASYGIQFELR